MARATTRPTSRGAIIARRRLTLLAVPVPARVVSEDLAGAVVTLLDMAAEGSGAACADVTERPQLRGGETALAEELLLVLAKDIGDFEPMSAHF